MPFTVNAWFAKNKIFNSKKIKTETSFFSPVISIFTGGNVGHSNIVYNFFGTEEEVNAIRARYPYLQFEDLTKVENSKTVYGIGITLSFWPGYRSKPGLFQRFTNFFKLIKGDKPHFNNHRTDMVMEAPSDKCAILHGFRVIDRSKPVTPDNVEYPVLNILHEIKTLENMIDIQKKLREFYNEEQIKREKYSKLKGTQRYIRKYEKRRPKNQMQQANDDIATMDLSIAAMEARVAELRKSLPVQGKSLTFTRDFFVTGGVHADISIPIPAIDVNGQQILDEFKILDEIQRQVIDNNNQYSLLTHNCCDAARQCLSAGLSEDKKQQMQSSKKSSSIFSHPGNFIPWVFAFVSTILGKKKVQAKPANEKTFQAIKYTRQW